MYSPPPKKFTFIQILLLNVILNVVFCFKYAFGVIAT